MFKHLKHSVQWSCPQLFGKLKVATQHCLGGASVFNYGNELPWETSNFHSHISCVVGLTLSGHTDYSHLASGLQHFAKICHWFSYYFIILVIILTSGHLKSTPLVLFLFSLTSKVLFFQSFSVGLFYCHLSLFQSSFFFLFLEVVLSHFGQNKTNKKKSKSHHILSGIHTGKDPKHYRWDTPPRSKGTQPAELSSEKYLEIILEFGSGSDTSA